MSPGFGRVFTRSPRPCATWATARKDFNPENSIYVGGGLKRAKLPEDYREFVYETFNIQPERNYQNYSMQELHSGMPRCQKGGRYHVPPWVVPLILDKAGDDFAADRRRRV